MAQILPLLLMLQRAPTPVRSHGFLSAPRSRNLVAYEDRIYHPVSSSDPLPEDCPTCLNRGGSLARCGVVHAGSTDGGERNYDSPKNAAGGAMRWNPQGGYVAGSVIEAEVLLTAHHKGHFEFKACPVSSNNNNATATAATAAPTQECFDAHPLTFVSDELYGAPPDANHPERAYVAPDAVANRVASSRPGFEGGMVFRYRLRLPEGILAGSAGGGGGGSALLQWYYVASNSACVHPGYDEYDWPLDWLASSSGGGGGGGGGEEEHEGDGDSTSSSGSGIAASVWEQKASVGTGLKMCDEVLPADGNGKSVFESL